MSTHNTSPYVHKSLSVWLDVFRWAAAVVLVISHIKGLFFVNYSELVNPHPIVTLLYMVASAGHQAVIIFFVLSGYFISNSVINSIRKQTWSWKVYLMNRFTRLYIVLIPALLLGAIWDQTGIHYFGHTGIYDGLPEDQYILDYSSKDHLVWQDFFGSLFYLQGILTGHFGSNGPLWSLAYEFWYYTIFSFLAWCSLLYPEKQSIRRFTAC